MPLLLIVLAIFGMGGITFLVSRKEETGDAFESWLSRRERKKRKNKKKKKRGENIMNTDFEKLRQSILFKKNKAKPWWKFW